MNRIKTVLLLGLLTGLFLFIGGSVAGRAGATMALFFAGLMNLGAWWFSDRIVLRMHGAREVTPADAPGLHGMVTELAAQAGIPVPKVYIVEDPQPNAFATGRNPAHGAVAVTSGILRILDDAELRGVIAHELGHIKNRDTLISTVAATIAGAISWLAQMVFFFGAGARDDDDGGGLGGLAMLIISPFLALIIQMAISRSREFGADAAGARWSGSGEPLARALLKLEQAAGRIPSYRAQPAFEPLYIVHPFKGGGRISKLFSTHPSTEERVERLMRLSPDGGAGWGIQRVREV